MINVEELAKQSATREQMDELEGILNDILASKHKYLGLTNQKDREYAIKLIRETNDTLIKCKKDYVDQFDPNSKYPICIYNWFADELILQAKNNFKSLELLLDIDNGG